MENENRTKRINVPVSDAELARFRRAAWRDERPLAQFVRFCLERRAIEQERAIGEDAKPARLTVEGN